MVTSGGVYRKDAAKIGVFGGAEARAGARGRMARPLVAVASGKRVIMRSLFAARRAGRVVTVGSDVVDGGSSGEGSRGANIADRREMGRRTREVG